VGTVGACESVRLRSGDCPPYQYRPEIDGFLAVDFFFFSQCGCFLYTGSLWMRARRNQPWNDCTLIDSLNGGLAFAACGRVVWIVSVSAVILDCAMRVLSVWPLNAELPQFIAFL